MLHRNRTREASRDAVTSNTTVARKRHLLEKKPTMSDSVSASLQSSSGQKHALRPTTSKTGSSKPLSQRPSALPRSTSGGSAGRAETMDPSKPSGSRSEPGRSYRHHGRPASEDVPLIFDNSLLPRGPETTQPLATTMSKARSGLDMNDDTVLGIALPEKPVAHKTAPFPPRLIPELQALAGHPARTPRPAAPSVSTMSSPSTRFTESPAPWSASTATTTPVSWSSASPAIVSTHSMKFSEQKSKTVPQPAATRSRLPKLPIPHHESVQQSVSPLSQGHSTPADERRGREKKQKGIAESPAPTPPPRTSSVKRGGSRSGNRSAASSIDETLAKTGPPTILTPEPQQRSPLASRARYDVRQIGESMTSPASKAHDVLQQSITAAPPRPTRQGTTDLGESRPMIMNKHRAGFAPQHRHLLASALEETVRGLKSTSGTREPDPKADSAERSESRLGKFSRLGLFTRRGTPSSDTDKSPGKKLQRRGPTAGTGHEGYGKYGRRGRKVSVESSSTRSESDRSLSSTRRIPEARRLRKDSASSRQNRSSQSDIEEFVAPRLKPLVMRGGSQTSVVQEAAVIDQSSYLTTPELGSTRGWSPSPGFEDPRSFGARSPLKDRQAISPSTHDQVPRLALRRSQRFGPGADSFRLPEPIRTDDLRAPTYISSYDTSQSSVVASSMAPSSAALEAYAPERPSTAVSEKETKKQRRWWNPFRRPQPIPISEPARPSIPEPEPEPEMAVAIAAGPAPRSVPYYAMIESESENNTTDLMGEYLAEATVYSSESPSPQLQATTPRKLEQKRESVLLPAAPTRSAGTPSSHQGSPDLSSQQGRQPRLAHVGRIPKVVSRNERQHRPSRQSFSQPFARRAAEDDPAVMSGALEPERPQLEIHTDMLPSRPFTESENTSAKPASAPARATFEQVQHRQPDPAEIMHVHSGRGSEVSTSSVSAGVISIMEPSLIPSIHNQTMHHIRNPSALTAEEEIWQEYDDFIDHVMSPSRSPNLRPLQPASKFKEPVSESATRPTSRGKMLIPEPRRAMLDLSLPSSGTPPSMFGSPALRSDRSVGDEVRLRRSRIVSALHSSMDPSSPFSMREFLKDYGGNGRESMGMSERLSTSTSGRADATTPTAAGIVQKQSPPEQDHQENAALLDVVGRAKDPAKQSELHYASLEVARWLSFGRVLFSPAHDEVQRIPDRKVLVIDGLGNEDWSIYCAVTYEGQKALVYDLKETFSYGPPAKSKDQSRLLPNHRRVETANLAERFPFHSSFFSAIVLRFPPAMSEAKMKNILSECRRILAPGGHLEIMLLDFDFVNMGVQTRRALRELKIRMAIKDPHVNLKPAIDNFQGLLGGRGFGSLNRCIVGVPVTGRPAGSTDSSTSSRSSGGSGRVRQMHGESGRITGGRGHNLSLNELVADHSENADAKIGRVVSRTARSWWQHCFEAAVIPDGDASRSILADKRVLQECKSRASSFKLLIAYAQKPVFETKRRTMSEPQIATLATAGTQRRMKSHAQGQHQIHSNN